MAGMHALHKILANCARPRRATVAEEGVVRPGMLAIAIDSHAPTMGAIGMYSTSLGGGRLTLYATNFGCGSSTPAHYSIVCPEILGLVESGDTLEVDTDTCMVRNIASGKSLEGRVLPEIYRAMIEAGGEKPASPPPSPLYVYTNGCACLPSPSGPSGRGA